MTSHAPMALKKRQAGQLAGRVGVGMAWFLLGVPGRVIPGGFVRSVEQMHGENLGEVVPCLLKKKKHNRDRRENEGDVGTARIHTLERIQSQGANIERAAGGEAAVRENLKRLELLQEEKF